VEAKRWFGTWSLETCEVRSASGVTSYPYGKNGTGYIMYLEPNRMAVAISGENRRAFAVADMLGGTEEEKSAAIESYVSYCGTFQVGEQSVIHRIDVSLFPNWVGTSQERLYSFDGDTLHLSTNPFLFNGKQQTAHLIWNKV
jgi:hypothetical protein